MTLSHPVSRSFVSTPRSCRWFPKNTGTLVAPEGAKHARILGVGGYRPERVVTNEEVCEFIDSSDQWIRERSGIITRRIANEQETVTFMAEAAARNAIENSGIELAQIDALLVATVTHPFQTPRLPR